MYYICIEIRLSCTGCIFAHSFKLRMVSSFSTKRTYVHFSSSKMGLTSITTLIPMISSYQLLLSLLEKKSSISKDEKHFSNFLKQAVHNNFGYIFLIPWCTLFNQPQLQPKRQRLLLVNFLSDTCGGGAFPFMMKMILLLFIHPWTFALQNGVRITNSQKRLAKQTCQLARFSLVMLVY